MNKTKLKFHKIEIIVTAFLLLIVLMVVSRYVITAITGEDIGIYAVNKMVTISNTRFSQKENKVNNLENLQLINMDSEWKVYSKTGPSKNFRVNNIDGKVAIERLSQEEGKPFEVQINNVNTYYSNSNIIVTDIMFDNSSEYLYIPLQEDMFPIFGYHNVFDNDEEIKDPFLDIRTKDFEQQIKFYNSELNCRWLTLSDLTKNYIGINKKIPNNTCVITFDDGRKNNIDIVYPLLEKHHILASFYIIAGRLGQKSFMTNNDVKKLYQAGHEIGSHSLTGGSLIDTSWYNTFFTEKNLWDQVNGSKELLNSFGYNVSTFAYPIGDFDTALMDAVKKANYIAARATAKVDHWRDPRALSTSTDSNFNWTLNYYKPELKHNNTILSEVKYNGFWQFEEGLEYINDNNKNIQITTTNAPTKTSYATVILEDQADTIRNSFNVGYSGNHILNVLASSGDLNNAAFEVRIDGVLLEPMLNSERKCIESSKYTYCYYSIRVFLSEGLHNIDTINKSGVTILDKFQIEREIISRHSYSMQITND